MFPTLKTYQDETVYHRQVKPLSIDSLEFANQLFTRVKASKIHMYDVITHLVEAHDKFLEKEYRKEDYDLNKVFL